MPKWLDDCVSAYLKKGLKSDEAWQRCKGAEKKRDLKDKKNKKK
jgi:hypothetical protein